MLRLRGLPSRTELETQYCLIQVHGLIHYDSLLFLVLSFKNNFLFSLCLYVNFLHVSFDFRLLEEKGTTLNTCFKRGAPVPL